MKPGGLSGLCLDPVGDIKGLEAYTHFFERTARNPNVRLEIMAVVNPIQLKDRSDAEAMPTPTCSSIHRTQIYSAESVNPKPFYSSCFGNNSHGRTILTC